MSFGGVGVKFMVKIILERTHFSSKGIEHERMRRRKP